MLRGLFEGAQYNSEAWAKCAVYSRARTKQGRGVIKEIRYVMLLANVCKTRTFGYYILWSCIDHMCNKNVMNLSLKVLCLKE